LCRSLWRPPMVDVRDLVHAGNSAVRRARFFGNKFTANILNAVLLQRNCRISALLRAVMDQSILTDIQVSRPGTTAPVVWTPVGNRLLEMIEARVIPLLKFFHLQVHFALFRLKRL